MTQDSILNELDAAIEAFTVPLRMGDGFDESKFQELCSVMRECNELWTDLDYIPKRAAVELFGLSFAIEACSYLYDEDTAKRVKYAASKVSNLTLSIVSDSRNLPNE